MKKTVIIITILIVLILIAYRLKNNMGRNLFASHSLHRVFPFKYLQRDEIIDPFPGEFIIEESFEPTLFSSHHWGRLWQAEEDKVVQKYDPVGIRSSKCLYIISETKYSWVYPHSNLIKVQKGDAFSCEGFAWIQGDTVYTTFCLTLLDENKNVFDWDYGRSNDVPNNKVTKISKLFTVPDSTAFIRFRIIGRGMGEFKYDDITFRKLESNR